MRALSPSGRLERLDWLMTGLLVLLLRLSLIKLAHAGKQLILTERLACSQHRNLALISPSSGMKPIMVVRPIVALGYQTKVLVDLKVAPQAPEISPSLTKESLAQPCWLHMPVSQIHLPAQVCLLR